MHHYLHTSNTIHDVNREELPTYDNTFIFGTGENAELHDEQRNCEL